MNESERVKLARSLHDGIAQDLVALSYSLQGVLTSESLDLVLRRQLRAIESDLRTLTTRIRDEIFELRNPWVDNLAGELETQSENFDGEISLKISDVRLPRDIATLILQLYRNAITHARASRIEVSVTCNESSLVATIADDGVGGAYEKNGRYGLIELREITAIYNGKFSITEENGTKIWIEIPYPQFS